MNELKETNSVETNTDDANEHRHNDIPECPKANLARLKSICKGWEEKLARKEDVQERYTARLVRAEEAAGADNYEDADEEQQKEMRQRQAIVRKYKFDVERIGKEVSRLKGKIRWITRQQIPFAVTEVDRLNVDADEKVDSEQEVDAVDEVKEVALAVVEDKAMVANDPA